MDFIPKVKVDFIPDENEITNHETKEEQPNFIYEEEESNDINPSNNGMSEDKEIQEESIFENIPKQTPKKKGRKPMSEEHKAKLKFAREKAMEVRKAKAQEKKKMKDMENETKHLQKLKKEKELNKLKKEVLEDAPPPQPIPDARPPPPPITPKSSPSGITKADLEEAQLNAIIKYEALRKERKKVKKQNQDELNRNNEMRRKLLRAMNPQNNYSNFNNTTGGF